MVFTSFPLRPKYSQLVNKGHASDGYSDDEDNSYPTGLFDDTDSDDATYQFSSSHSILPPVNLRRQLFPFSIVWGPLPVISWCLPCIGM